MDIIGSMLEACSWLLVCATESTFSFPFDVMSCLWCGGKAEGKGCFRVVCDYCCHGEFLITGNWNCKSDSYLCVDVRVDQEVVYVTY